MDDIRGAYTEAAEVYIDLFGSTSAFHADDLALIDRHLGVLEGRVIDLGCGPGHLTDHLRRRGVDAMGIDLVPRFIEHARTTYPDVEYAVGSMDALPITDGTAAGLVSWYSLIHLAPDAIGPVLDELRRVAAAGAPLIVGFFVGETVESFPHKVATGYRWPVDQFASRLRDAGFAETERLEWPGEHVSGRRPHATIAAQAV